MERFRGTTRVVEDPTHPEKTLIYSNSLTRTLTLITVRQAPYIQVTYPFLWLFVLCCSNFFSCLHSWFGISFYLFIILLGVRSSTAQCLASNLHCSLILCFGILFLSLSLPHLKLVSSVSLELPIIQLSTSQFICICFPVLSCMTKTREGIINITLSEVDEKHESYPRIDLKNLLLASYRTVSSLTAYRYVVSHPIAVCDSRLTLWHYNI
ncbi:hypothetical protein BDY19DRAFT_359279 [Irpex rosettiformis]|uniref:Uncharacterized protein n=1 Tax=Irpex rosettiformis TaxID=378272 RepID=A0ACB8TWM6_9APHY|nr:hypothetical protein BDY19DRAFT_359279 [Irpex rosettiformis]